MALIVHEGEGEDEMNFEQNFESNPVSQAEFGEYVASLHSLNNSTFILQYEVCIANNHTNHYKIACTLKFTMILLQSLASGEEGKKVKVGKSEANRPLNRFRNITACKIEFV